MSWRAGLAFAALSVIWGIPYLFIKIAVAEVSPIGVAWCDLALGAAALLPVAWRRGALQSTMRHKRAICALAVAQLALPSLLLALGERWIGSALTATMIAGVPLVVILLAPFFGVSERLGPRSLVGFVVGFAGVVLLLGFDTINGPHAWAGVSCIAVATVAYAASPLIIQRHLAGVDELGAVAASLGVATVILLPGVVLSVPATPSLLVLISLVVLGVACTAVGLLLYFFLIRQAGVARASIVTYINPAVAVLLGVAFLHEPFHLNSILGLLLILVGSWVATQSAPESDRPKGLVGKTRR